MSIEDTRSSEKSIQAPRLSRRAMQAAQTRADILQAARRQFAQNGYAGASLKQIAMDANVAVQTVYDSVGSKAELVRGLNDLIDEEAQIDEIVAELFRETDPARILATPARVTRRIVERSGDIARTCINAAHSEPELAAVIAEGRRRHRMAMTMIVTRLREVSEIPLRLPDAELARAMSILSDVQPAIMVVDDYGFEFDALERWIASTIWAVAGIEEPDSKR